MATCQDYADNIPVTVKHRDQPEPVHIPRFRPVASSLLRQGYDFQFERKTLQLTGQWEQRRKLLAEKDRKLEEERQAKVELVAETLAKARLAAVSYPDDIDEEENDDHDEERHASEDEELAEDTSILRPQVQRIAGAPAQAPASTWYQHPKMRHPTDLTRLSVFDFDSDTSSPFDNMELKTLNDMELLAEVLECDRPSAPSPPPPPPPPPVSVLEECADLLSRLNSHEPERPPEPDEVVSGIVRELLEEIDGRRRNRCEFSSASVADVPAPETPLPETAILSRENTREDLGNPYYILSPALQTLCERITSMGFPLDRVARACEELGEDNKKIIEYLLMMGQIMDLGFPESKVAKALLDNDFNRDKALDQLIS